ncbi:MAG: hypothetical protein ABR589_02165 [Chthoniobacterales bacterium]
MLRRLIILLLLAAIYLPLFWLAHVPIVTNSGTSGGFLEDPFTFSKATKGFSNIPITWLDGFPRFERKELLTAADAVRNAVLIGANVFVFTSGSVLTLLGFAVACFVAGIFQLNPMTALVGPIIMLVIAAIALVGIPICGAILWLGLAFQHATAAYYCIYIPFGLALLAAGGAGAATPVIIIIIFPR